MPGRFYGNDFLGEDSRRFLAAFWAIGRVARSLNDFELSDAKAFFFLKVGAFAYNLKTRINVRNRCEGARIPS